MSRLTLAHTLLGIDSMLGPSTEETLKETVNVSKSFSYTFYKNT